MVHFSQFITTFVSITKLKIGMKKFLHLLAFTLFALAITSCGSGASSSKKMGADATVENPAKYIFYFIGDGMTAAQVRLAEAALSTYEFRDNYASLAEINSTPSELFLKSLNVTGLATSNAANRYITDSAAAGTALATGSKTDVGIISLTNSGQNLQTIAERAKANGMKVGIVSSVSIDHATPACFYAHTASRNSYTEISNQLLTSGFDYFGGGSVKFDSRAYTLGIDKATAYEEYRQSASEAGYKFVTSRDEFNALGKGEDSLVIATLNMLSEKQYSSDGHAMPYTIDLKSYDSDDRISLADFTKKGIELLDNKKGFFMMVEGGKIDWACHANDAATCAYEVVAFDQAIGEAMLFAARHPRETLIVVTGDHDCGGLALGFAGTGYESAFELLSNSNTSYARFSEAATAKIRSGAPFSELLKMARQSFGFTNLDTDDNPERIAQTMELSQQEINMLREAYNKSYTKTLTSSDKYHSTYGGYDPFTTTCTSILNKKAGVDFTSFSHTAVPVMVFAGGAGEELFSGYYDNTDIAKRIMIAAGIE